LAQTLSVRKEVTWQAIVGAILVSAIVSGAYPYVVLKLGMGPNISIVAAFFGAIWLSFLARSSRGSNRLQNNIIQTAATAASGTAFMCVVAAAFGYLNMNESVQVHTKIGPWAMFFWLTLTGFIGVLFTVIFRRTYIDDPKMVFADGIAAAETIVVLDDRSSEGKKNSRVLGFAGIISGLMDWFRDGKPILQSLYISKGFSAGLEWNLLSVGSGILIGWNVAVSMLLGTLVVVFVAGPWIMSSGIGLEIVRSNIAPVNLAQCDTLYAMSTIPNGSAAAKFFADHCGNMARFKGGSYFSTVLLWTMWPATGMMVAAAFTALLLKWKVLVRTFTELRQRQQSAQREDVSLRTIVTLGLIFIAILALIQKASFGMGYAQTVVSILASLPLMLVGIRVLGETNQGPVSLMSNALQAVFAVFWPHSLALNLIGAGIAGSSSAESEGMMQCYKTGKIVGSTPRILTWAAFIGVPIGAAAVAIMYPLLIARYGLGGDGLSAPTGLKLANMAVLLSKGVSALPQGALTWTIIAVVVGIIIEIFKDLWPKAGEYVPSPAAFGFALILPGLLNIPMAIGGLSGAAWEKLRPASYKQYAIVVASGLIAGEAVIGGLLIPILAALKVI